VTAEDRTLGLLPFFHIYGLTAVQFGSLQDGAHLYTLPRFDPEAFLKVMHEKKVSLEFNKKNNLVYFFILSVILLIDLFSSFFFFLFVYLRVCRCGCGPM
jgi:acyl-CoA synthetase (AMP-forming)/AMP-acid ligase II